MTILRRRRLPRQPARRQEPDPLLLSEIQHYRDRWKSTERITEQRMAMLLTAIGAAIAISAALLVHGSTAAGVNTATLLSILWYTVAIVAEGMFLRLIRARRSIHRDVELINFLRDHAYATAPPEIGLVLIKAKLRDSKPPKIFSPFSLPSSAAVVASVSLLFAIWFAGSPLATPRGGAEPVPSIAYALSGMLFVLNLGYFVCASRFRVDSHLTSHTHQ